MDKRMPDERYESALTDIGKPFETVRPISFHIQIDPQRCRFSNWDPTGCKKCMKICPEIVFGALLNERRITGVQPQHYKLAVVYPELCNGCGACVRVCPHQAITIRRSERAR